MKIQVESSALDSLMVMVQKLQDERDALHGSMTFIAGLTYEKASGDPMIAARVAKDVLAKNAEMAGV